MVIEGTNNNDWKSTIEKSGSGILFEMANNNMNGWMDGWALLDRKTTLKIAEESRSGDDLFSPRKGMLWNGRKRFKGLDRNG